MILSPLSPAQHQSVEELALPLQPVELTTSSPPCALPARRFTITVPLATVSQQKPE